MALVADPVLARLTDYITEPPLFSASAYRIARLSLLDSLGCAMLALDAPECRRLLGPLAAPPAEPDAPAAAPDAARAPGTARVPGTALALDPVTAAFNTGTLIRWLDYNDTWLAAEWGHPSDNLGALLAAAQMRGLTVRDLLAAQIQAYEIQGILALQNSFNRLGLDHVILVRIASAGVAARLLGGTPEQVLAALSHAFLDGGALRTYRHGATTGSRKSWAAGDATSRGLWLALLALRGEMGYPAALSAPRWGFQDVVLRGAELRLDQPLGCYVAENILFKVGFPAEFHGQTAVEAAFTLHPQVAPRAGEVAEIIIHTQESALRIIDKQGPLTTPAARDHCLQYMVAVALLYGELRSEHYRDASAADPRIDCLRERTTVYEDARYSAAYLEPERARHRQPPPGALLRRHADPRGGGGIPARPSAPARRGGAALESQVRAQHRRAVLTTPRRRHSAPVGRPGAHRPAARRPARRPPYPVAPPRGADSAGGGAGTRIRRMPPTTNNTAMLSTPMLESPVT